MSKKQELRDLLEPYDNSERYVIIHTCMGCCIIFCFALLVLLLVII